MNLCTATSALATCIKNLVSFATTGEANKIRPSGVAEVCLKTGATVGRQAHDAGSVGVRTLRGSVSRQLAKVCLETVAVHRLGSAHMAAQPVEMALCRLCPRGRHSEFGHKCAPGSSVELGSPPKYRFETPIPIGSPVWTRFELLQHETGRARTDRIPLAPMILGRKLHSCPDWAVSLDASRTGGSAPPFSGSPTIRPQLTTRTVPWLRRDDHLARSNARRPSAGHNAELSEVDLPPKGYRLRYVAPRLAPVDDFRMRLAPR